MANDLRSQIRAIQEDATLDDAQKAVKRQALMSGNWQAIPIVAPSPGAHAPEGGGDAGSAQEPGTTILDDTLKCAFCFNLCERPITAPCQHNFCLACFARWAARGKSSCPTCRAPFPPKLAANPRINTALAAAIRMVKQGGDRPAKAEIERVANSKRPDEAFTTDRAQRGGMANAASGRIFVTCPGDHFGPITAEHDPDNNRGVRVGDHWKDRLSCRQYGAHLPHVAGIAGQSATGAQSVVLSGGYEDDVDQGEWFLYTGSGGRDLSGNKRISKVQDFDQEFTLMNKALQLSCERGLPVRVVRSHKEKRSNYAPTADEPVRYDGIYQIASCWRKAGAQGKLMCRYLFVRADNEPAPWSSEVTGDKPYQGVPPEALEEQKVAAGSITCKLPDPYWDWDAGEEVWGWSRNAPASRRAAEREGAPSAQHKKVSSQEKALTEFRCRLCSQLAQQPVSTPCSHVFCKPCLDAKFSLGVARAAPTAGRTRVRKEVMPCPACQADIADFLRSVQENREMAAVIARLQQSLAESKAALDGGLLCQEPASRAVKAPAEASGSSAEAAGSISGARPSNPPTTSAAAAPAASGAAAELAVEFPRVDASLIETMLEDQGGDVADVRTILRKMQGVDEALEKKNARLAKKATPSKQMAIAAAHASVGAEQMDTSQDSTDTVYDAGRAARAHVAARGRKGAAGGAQQAAGATALGKRTRQG